MRLGLGARLALLFALLAGLTAIVTAGVSAYSTTRQINADIDDFLNTRSLDIAEGRRSGLNLDVPRQAPGRGDNGKRVDPPGDAIILTLVESDAVVQVLDVTGAVVVRAGFALPVEAVDEPLLTRRSKPVLRDIEVDGEQYRMITRHVDGGGAVQVAQSLTTTNALLGDLRSDLLLVGFAMSALAGLMGWGVAQRTTRPLRKLTATVETVAATEDLSMPVALDRGDEIGRLSEEFEAMLATLNASRNQQQHLVQDAAHELRTPLTSVRANIDFLERARDLDEYERLSTLHSIKAELAELSEVLAEIVELATESRGAASFELIDLRDIADSALAQFELRSARPVKRDLHQSFVRGDRASLVRAAQNLIGNADKYSPDGLSITVSVVDGSFSVADQGPGIDPAERERVFDRFYRSDRDRSAPGSGLGLAIVAKAATEHGGRVWAHEAPGGGAHVGFTLPQTTDAVHPRIDP